MAGDVQVRSHIHSEWDIELLRSLPWIQIQPILHRVLNLLDGH